MNTYGGSLWAFDYSSTVNYSITILIGIYALSNARMPNKKDFTLCIIISVFGLLSYTFGTLNGHITNIRGIILPSLFGVRPKPELIIAFSISSRLFGSNACTTIN